jgi:hypothetical protein
MDIPRVFPAIRLDPEVFGRPNCRDDPMPAQHPWPIKYADAGNLQRGGSRQKGAPEIPIGQRPIMNQPIGDRTCAP